jgi:peptidoglycan/LPS O-acetylase OafA/YrhL
MTDNVAQPIRSSHSQNNINFLRLLLASLVIVSHAPEISYGGHEHELLYSIFGTMTFGGFAVACFFLLSGFLIVKSWQNKPDIKSFFEKRIRRIYPGFAVALFISVFIFAPFGTPNAQQFLAGINIWQLFKDAVLLQMPAHIAGAYPGTHYAHVNGSLWTISYEFQCYASVALVGILVPNKQKFVWPLLFLIAVVFSFLVEPFKQGRFFGVVWLVPPMIVTFANLFIYFAAGACFYLFRAKIPLHSKGLLVLLPFFILAMFRSFLSKVGLATAGAYCLFWLSFANIPALNWFKRTPDLSYGIYLYGWPIQKLLFWYFPDYSPWVLLPLTFAMSCLAGYLSWELVEAPFLNRKGKNQPAIRPI